MLDISFSKLKSSACTSQNHFECAFAQLTGQMILVQRMVSRSSVQQKTWTVYKADDRDVQLWGSTREKGCSGGGTGFCKGEPPYPPPPESNNMTMEHPSFEDVFPIENGDFPLSC